MRPASAVCAYKIPDTIPLKPFQAAISMIPFGMFCTRLLLKKSLNAEAGAAAPESGEDSDCVADGSADTSPGSPPDVPAVPVAWATAAACPPSPPGLVVDAGSLNGANFPALADVAA